MEKQINKIIEGNVIIPKVPAWTFILGVVAACVTAFFSLSNRVTHVEKDITNLTVQIKENKNDIKENKNTYKEILSELKDINTALNLKQDKKFIE
jgi:chromosome segregation ATPase